MLKIFQKLISTQLILIVLFVPFLEVQAVDVPVADKVVRENTAELLEELAARNFADKDRTSRYLVPINASVVAGNSNLSTGIGEILGIFYQLASPGSGLTRNIYSEALGYIEDELGVDKDALKKASTKIPAPTVEVIFDNTTPKEGEKVTASALPENFKNNIEDLYFTWFIVSTNESGEAEGSMEEAKKKAMGLVARGSFDPVLYNIDYGEEKDENRDGFKAPFGGADGVGAKDSECEEECVGNCDCLDGSEGCIECFDDRGEPMFYGFDILDNKDWSERVGRESWELEDEDYIFNESKSIARTEAITRCYKRNFGRKFKDDGDDKYAGRDLIVECEHNFPTECGEIGDGEFNAEEEECWKTNPNNADTDGDGVMDEADLAGLGQKSITWNYRKGDRVGVIVEGTSVLEINEGSSERLQQKRSYIEDENMPRDDQQAEYKKKLEECEKLKTEGGEVEFPDPDGVVEAEGLNEPNYTSEDYHDEGERLKTDSATISAYYTCMKNLWSFKKDKSIEAQGEMVGYNKIMFATLGTCSEEDMEFMEEDMCDEEKHFGFPYLATIPVEETYEKVMNVNVVHSPKNPQFNSEDGDSTDSIVARSVVTDHGVNPDALYYKWKVLRCDPIDFDECEEDVTETADTSNGASSPFEGLGLKEIVFKPTEETFGGGDGKVMLKFIALIWKNKNADIVSPTIGATYDDGKTQMLIDKAAQTEQFVPLTRNAMKLKVYSFQARGTKWADPWEICNDGLYKRVCPVYPFQVIAVEVEDDGGDDLTNYNWSLNGKKIEAPNLPLSKCQEIFTKYSDVLCKGNEANGDFGKAVYFPVVGNDYDMLNLSVTAERKNNKEGITDDDLVAERLFSINRPLAVLGFSDNVKLENNVGGVSGSMFNVHRGEKLDIEAKIIPLYLNEHSAKELSSSIQSERPLKEAFIKWSMNDNSISGDLTSKKVSLPSCYDSLGNLRARTIKNFSSDYQSLLKDSWEVVGVDSLYSDTDVQLRCISNQPGEYGWRRGDHVVGDGTASISGFMASTVSNSPYYLMFILRLAIALVLLWVVVFGLFYIGGTTRIKIVD